MAHQDNEIMKAILVVSNFTKNWIKQKKETIKEYKLTYYDKKKMNNLEIAVKILTDFYHNVTHEGENNGKTRRSTKK